MGDAGNAGGAEAPKKGVKFGSARAKIFEYMGTPLNISKGKTLRKRNLNEVFKASKVPYTRQELNYLLGLLKLYGDEEVKAYFKMKEEKLGRPPSIENISPESMESLIEKGYKNIFRNKKGRPISLFDLVKEQIDNETAQKKMNYKRNLKQGKSIRIKDLLDKNNTRKIGRELERLRDLKQLMEYQIKNTNTEDEKDNKRKMLKKLEKNMAARHRLDQLASHLYAVADTDSKVFKNLVESTRALKNEWYRPPPVAHKKAQATRKVRSASPRAKHRV